MKSVSEGSSINYLIESEGSIQSLSEQRQADDEEAMAVIKVHVVDLKPPDRLYRGSDLPELLAKMAITVTEDELRPVIPGDWKKISCDGVMDVLASLKPLKGFEWTVVAEHLRNSGVLKLGPYDYLRYKLGMMDDDPLVVSATRVALQLHIPPRYILYVSTGLILLLAGGVIVALMAGLWMDKADQREKDQSVILQNIIQLFTEKLANAMLESQGEFLQEEAFALVEVLSIRHEKVDLYHSNDLRKDALTYALAFQKVVDVDIEPLVGSMRMLETIFLNQGAAAVGTFALGMSDLVATLKEWSTQADLSFWRYVVTNSTGTVYDSTGACAVGTPCSLHCLSTGMYAAPTTIGNYSNVAVNRSDVDAANLGAWSWGLQIPSIDATVCAFLSNASYVQMRLKRIARMTASGNLVPIGSTILGSKDMVIATVSNLSAPKVNWETPHLRYEDPCYEANLCNEVDEMVKNVSITKITQVGNLRGYTNTILLAAAAYSGDGIIVVLTEEHDNVRRESTTDLVSIFASIASREQRTTVTVSGYLDNGDIDVDLGNFHILPEQCMGACIRFYEGEIAGRAALSSKRSGWLIQHDYRQQPVIAGYGYLAALDLGIVLERSIETLRNKTLYEVLVIINDGNNNIGGTSEAAVVRFKGMPSNRVFDRYEDCTHVEVCRPHFLEPEKYGIVYRSDCPDCSQRPVNLTGEIEYLSDTLGCWSCNPHLDEIAIRPLTEENAVPRDIIGSDYRGKEVIAAYRYMTDLSVGIIVKVDREEVRNAIVEKISIAVAVAIVIIVLGMIALILFSQRVLQRIEREWLTYKEKIDTEKDRFAGMVSHVLPARITARLTAMGERSATLTSSSYIFVDIVGFGAVVKDWEPGFVGKYMLYYQKMVLFAAEFYHLDKIRSIGDAFFIVGGLTLDALAAGNSTRQTKGAKLREEKNRRADRKDSSRSMSSESESEASRGPTTPAILESVNFAACLVQLCSPTYAHFPEKVEDVQKSYESHAATFGNVFPGMNTDAGEGGSLTLLPVRVGVHYGPATYTILETDTTPSFDVFGPGVALAKRMEATSSPNFIHLTESAKEALSQADTRHQFSFDGARRTAVKGIGTVTSFFLSSADITVPSTILSKFKIQQANWRVYHEEFSQALPSSPSARSPREYK
jgi:class 3 adenylate cyclase